MTAYGVSRRADARLVNAGRGKAGATTKIAQGAARPGCARRGKSRMGLAVLGAVRHDAACSVVVRHGRGFTQVGQGLACRGTATQVVARRDNTRHGKARHDESGLGWTRNFNEITHGQAGRVGAGPGRPRLGTARASQGEAWARPGKARA